MQVLSGYTLADLLLFSPRTYYRLLELYNSAVWPAHIVALAFGLEILLLLRRADALSGRLVASLLTILWLFVAIVFHAGDYATINWGAIYFAVGFGLEALLLAYVGIVRGG